MKVYMNIDMEGICGIVLKEQVIKGNREYEEARYLLIKEVNAAIEGALEGGADEIIAVDSHGTGFNFPLEELHPEARFILGHPLKSVRFPYLDSSFDMLFLIGVHAKAGTQGAVRDHSYSSVSVAGMTVNGIEMGEIGMDALICGYHDVPVALVTGDDKACSEAEKLFGDVETAVVKFGLGRHYALNYSPRKAREIIKKAACHAVKNSGKFKPYKLSSPYTVEIEYMSTDLADAIYVNGIDRKRAGPRKVVYITDNVLEIYSKSFS